MSESLLEMKEITKHFPGVVANDRVSLSLLAGEIHALVGENGAGKTTLMRILYGLYKPDGGSIAVKGRTASIRGPRDAIRLGIGMVHQHFMLLPPFSILENVILGEETQKLGVLSLSQPRRRINRIMEDNKLSLDLELSVEEIPVGLQQQVEILKILYRGATILIFDEPTAVLTPQEVDELFKGFREMKRQGKGIIFISHKLDEVLEIADRITVIRQGRIVQSLERSEATKSRIAELMVGKPVLLEVERGPFHPGATVLEVRELTVKSPLGVAVLNRLSLQVRAGEIYGIAGVEGNGQSELVRAVAVGEEIVGGDILLAGQSIKSWSVRKRKEAGIAHIPEDRQKFGLLLPFSVAQNLILGRHYLRPYCTPLQVIDAAAIRASAREIIARFDIRTPSEDTPAHALSGGNQQKAVVARELSAEPKLLIASQPTRGVDIGATEFIHRQLLKARDQGKAVLLVSADLDEVLSLCDRIGVIFKGRIIKEFDHESAEKKEVGFYMMGEKEHAEA